MPVILHERRNRNVAHSATNEALKLQRPLPNGSLVIVGTGTKEDEAA
jgi:hypothetical protein